MKITYGTEVQDKDGTVLGIVNYVVRDSWTGEIRKFTVWREIPGTNLFLTPDDVLKETESKITLSSNLNELEQQKPEL